MTCLNGDNWHIQQHKQQGLKCIGTLPGISSLIQLIIVSTIELLAGDRYLTEFIDHNTTAQGLEQECWVLDCIKFCCYFRRDSFPSFYCLQFYNARTIKKSEPGRIQHQPAHFTFTKSQEPIYSSSYKLHTNPSVLTLLRDVQGITSVIRKIPCFSLLFEESQICQ